MNKTKASIAALCLTVPVLALAGPYKCTGADGKVSFQDQPCQAGTTGGEIVIKAPQPADGVRPAPRPYSRPAADTAARDAAAARNDQIEAQNRASRCNVARQNLGRLKEQRPVFRYDNKGERQYLDDAARQSGITAAERSVAENCR